MNNKLEAQLLAQQQANEAVEPRYIFTDVAGGMGAYKVVAFSDILSLRLNADDLIEVMPEDYCIILHHCVSYILVQLEKVTFADIISQVNLGEDTDVLKVLTESGRSLEDLKSDVLKKCYSLLNQWNQQQLKKRSENEYWIKSFVRTTN